MAGVKPCAGMTVPMCVKVPVYVREPPFVCVKVLVCGSESGCRDGKYSG